MNIVQQTDVAVQTIKGLPVICDIIAEAYGARDLRKEIVLGTTAQGGTTLNEYEQRMKETMNPLTTYLNDKGISYQVNILQGTVHIPNVHETLLDILYEHEPRIASTTRRKKKDETFTVVETLDGTTLPS